jgi:hypothetical protein
MKKNFVYPFIVVFALLSIAGCASMREWYTRAFTANPEGDVPAAEIGKNITTLVGNPTNVDAWLETAEMLGYIILGGGSAAGAVALKRRVQAKREREKADRDALSKRLPS